MLPLANLQIDTACTFPIISLGWGENRSICPLYISHVRLWLSHNSHQTSAHLGSVGLELHTAVEPSSSSDYEHQMRSSYSCPASPEQRNSSGDCGIIPDPKQGSRINGCYWCTDPRAQEASWSLFSFSALAASRRGFSSASSKMWNLTCRQSFRGPHSETPHAAPRLPRPKQMHQEPNERCAADHLASGFVARDGRELHFLGGQGRAVHGLHQDLDDQLLCLLQGALLLVVLLQDVLRPLVVGSHRRGLQGQGLPMGTKGTGHSERRPT